MIAKQLTDPSDEVCVSLPILSRHSLSGPPPFHSKERYFKTTTLTIGATTHVKIKNTRLNLTYQRDEVGERHLDVYLSDVTTLLHGPDVLVVAFHQILEKLPFKVDR